jgi:hypothetical protein
VVEAAVAQVVLVIVVGVIPMVTVELVQTLSPTGALYLEFSQQPD